LFERGIARFECAFDEGVSELGVARFVLGDHQKQFTQLALESMRCGFAGFNRGWCFAYAAFAERVPHERFQRGPQREWAADRATLGNALAGVATTALFMGKVAQEVPETRRWRYSPTTRGYDLVKKRPFYARIGVAWLWYVDLEARTVTVSRLADGAWVEVAVHGDDERVRLAPFADVEMELSLWWVEGKRK